MGSGTEPIGAIDVGALVPTIAPYEEAPAAVLPATTVDPATAASAARAVSAAPRKAATATAPAAPRPVNAASARAPQLTRDQAAGVAALERRDYAAAIASFERAAADRTPQSWTMLGDAHFMHEDYAAAEKAYRKALEHTGGLGEIDSQLRELATRAKTNAQTGAAERIDPPARVTREQALASPRSPPGDGMPTTPPGRLDRIGAAFGSARDALRDAAKGSGGWVADWIVHGVEKAARLAENADPQAVWTDWYNYPDVVALMKLARMREALNTQNLKSAYPPSVRTAFMPPNYVCPAETAWVRTIDGVCNDPKDPKMGAAWTRFGRNVALDKTQPPSEQELLSPNPREVSRVLLTRDSMKEVPFLNMIAAAWIQFMVHDWVSHGENNSDASWKVPLAEDDPIRVGTHAANMEIPKTADDPTWRAEQGLPPTRLNAVTHWWDASQLYGSDYETANKLRSFQHGKLKLDENGNLPLDQQGHQLTGDRRNWWLGLSLLHTTFAREHNAICDMLREKHSDWTDQKLYDTARLINAAVLAKIHTLEWTTAILANPVLREAMNANWSGLRRDRWNTWFKVDQPELYGLVGNSRNLHDVAYSLTEEFVSVYRLHPLLPDSIPIRRIGEANADEVVPLGATRAKGANRLEDKYGVDNLLNAFGTSHPGALVLNNYPKALQDIDVPGMPRIDLGAVDILRDRERGVPRYNEFRRQLQLKPITKFEDLTDDAETVKKLKALYAGDVEKLDTQIGMLAEAHRPKFFGFGETAFQVFILNASRRLQADRFFTDLYRPEVYTQEGLDWVDKATMKGVLLRQYPQLGRSGLARRENAFNPWEE